MAYRKIKKDGTKAKPTKANKIPLGEFIVKVNEYISDCDRNKQIPLIGELAWYLGISRDTLENYRKNSKYVGIIKRVDEMMENGLLRKGINENKPVFPMFLLKSKFGYVEAQYQKVDLNVHGQLGIVQMPSKKPKVSG